MSQEKEVSRYSAVKHGVAKQVREMNTEYGSTRAALTLYSLKIQGYYFR
jgi:hypothetical protein